jgi:hypothetical protein
MLTMRRTTLAPKAKRTTTITTKREVIRGSEEVVPSTRVASEAEEAMEAIKILEVGGTIAPLIKDLSNLSEVAGFNMEDNNLAVVSEVDLLLLIKDAEGSEVVVVEAAVTSSTQ